MWALRYYSCIKCKRKHNVSVVVFVLNQKNFMITRAADDITLNLNDINANPTDGTTNNFSSSTTNNVNKFLFRTI